MWRPPAENRKSSETHVRRGEGSRRRFQGVEGFKGGGFKGWRRHWLQEVKVLGGEGGEGFFIQGVKVPGGEGFKAG